MSDRAVFDRTIARENVQQTRFQVTIGLPSTDEELSSQADQRQSTISFFTVDGLDRLLQGRCGVR